MALQAAVVSVGTAPVRLDAPESSGDRRSRIRLKNTGSTAAFLGSATVTVTTGYSLAAGESFDMDLESDEALYAISAVAATIHVIRTGI